jgi:hypothetical protein
MLQLHGIRTDAAGTCQSHKTHYGHMKWEMKILKAPEMKHAQSTSSKICRQLQQDVVLHAESNGTDTYIYVALQVRYKNS